MNFQEIPGDDYVPSALRLDREFKDIVITYPILEEVVFRGIVQPFLARAIALYCPRFNKPAFFDISTAAIISCVATGTIFGSVHYDGVSYLSKLMKK